MYVFLLILKFLHLVGLALALGTNFATLTLGMASKDLDPAERTKFLMRAGALRKNGSYGLAVLILTGVTMVVVRGVGDTFRWGGPAFHLKVTLVVILIGVFGYMQVVLKKVRLAGGGPLMAKLPTLSRVLLALSLAIVACAVIAFQ